MRITMEFDLPDEAERHLHAMRGEDYYKAIKELVESIKQKMDTQDCRLRYKYDTIYQEVFMICGKHGFSPWDCD